MSLNSLSPWIKQIQLLLAKSHQLKHGYRLFDDLIFPKQKHPFKLTELYDKL